MYLNDKEKELMRSQPAILVPVAEYTTAGIVQGIIIPTTEEGEPMMEMAGVSTAALAVYSKYLNAKRFSIKGTWTFVPDSETLQIHGEAPNGKLNGASRGSTHVRRSIPRG